MILIFVSISRTLCNVIMYLVYIQLQWFQHNYHNDSRVCRILARRAGDQIEKDKDGFTGVDFNLRYKTRLLSPALIVRGRM